ncbi:MAG: hypothetical protein CMP65_00990 [Flavobacteriales bacterium]|nr:hypothetical protein [Flavobacteriales bacterium]
MKHVLLITNLILFQYITCAQGVLNKSLIDEMNNTRLDEYIPIVIEIKDDFDVLKIKEEFNNSKTPVKQRASIICQRMQSIANETQKDILNFIKNSEDYQNLTSSWIINCIFLEARKNLIDSISNHSDIQIINLQNTQADIIEYFNNDSHNNIEIENGTEPGIEAINVRPLWDMGYTGRGGLVFNYDTGVWPEHPAYKKGFFANFYPMNQCWDGYFSDYPNGHISDHGTHTLGTIAGLVAPSNDTIGIAFNAYWIANDFVTSTVETLPPIQDMITSFEWALNPDNDLSTYHDVPDVINNSWRWYNEIDTFQCDGYAVELMNVIEAAGIANIFSAGNNGPNNTGVRSPQRINSNLVNTFCVGSINANNQDLLISTFSCRGPTQCPGEGSLSIYPEVVAPGQNIRSAWGNDGFNTISGTSMASPHVSGAVLLLKEAFPFLSGEEILLALYNTANDLGELGEDNIYGMGIIDAYAAFNYLSNNYIPEAPKINNGIELINVSNQPQRINCQQYLNPVLNIFNHTDSIIPQLKVSFKEYAYNMDVDSLIFNTDLGPYEFTSIQIPNIEIENYGDNEYMFKVNTINSLVENDYHNNQKMIRFKHKPLFETPYHEDFENGIKENDWHIENNDYYRTWDTISTQSNMQNNIAAYVNLSGYNPRAQQKDALISPNIVLNMDTTFIRFKYAYQKANNSSKQDTLTVYVSTNCGASFNDTIFQSGGDDLSSFNIVTPNFIPQNNDQWRDTIINLSNYLSQEIMLKFETTNLRGNNIFIDDIEIYNNDNNNVTITEKKLEISIRPNPSKGIFEINSYQNFINDILVYSSTGQLIKKINTNNTLENFKLDLGKNRDGLYFLEVKTNNTQSIYRIIKQ